MTKAQISVYCAPSPEVFARTAMDLRTEGMVLHEAATAVLGEEVPFVLCADSPGFALLFASPLNERMDEEELMLLAQGVLDYHQSECAKAGRPLS